MRRTYVCNQEKRHRKMTFQGEMRRTAKLSIPQKQRSVTARETEKSNRFASGRRPLLFENTPGIRDMDVNMTFGQKNQTTPERSHSMHHGFTLLELVAVLVILVALAGVVVPLVDGLEISTPTGDKTQEEIVTQTTMQAIRDAIMGTPGQPGVWADVGQRAENFPQRISDLFSESTPASIAIGNFNPVTKIGWRGPYFVQATGKFDFNGRHDDSFIAYGVQDELTLLDAWGNPIIIQVDFDRSGFVEPTQVDYDGDGFADGNEADFARLISAGPNGRIDTPETMVLPSQLPTGDPNDDDLVLFLRTADSRP